MHASSSSRSAGRTVVSRELRDTDAIARGAARVGCSGWHYRDWRGCVYPEGLAMAKWFAHYAASFDTVELNATFYRLPTPQAVERWRDQAPDGFVYALKLGAFGSHRMKLRDAATWLPNHLDRARRLGPALGPTLVQLPPRWRRDVVRLRDFLDVVADLAADLRWAVELREPSWIHDEVFELLASRRVALCIHDLLPEQPFVLTTNWCYVRFHGPDAVQLPYWGRYPAPVLDAMAARLRGELAGGSDVYAYFNNDHDGAAATDARLLRERLGA